MSWDDYCAEQARWQRLRALEDEAERIRHEIDREAWDAAVAQHGERGACARRGHIYEAGATGCVRCGDDGWLNQ